MEGNKPQPESTGSSLQRTHSGVIDRPPKKGMEAEGAQTMEREQTNLVAKQGMGGSEMENQYSVTRSLGVGHSASTMECALSQTRMMEILHPLYRTTECRGYITTEQRNSAASNWGEDGATWHVCEHDGNMNEGRQCHSLVQQRSY